MEERFSLVSDKIRTLFQLDDAISSEFAWRKKELSLLKTMVVSNKSKTAVVDSYIRMALPLLYAHWEGFVKAISISYLEYVVRQQMKINEAADCFVALATKKILYDTGESEKIRFQIELIQFLREHGDEKCTFNWKGAINTKSNLKSHVFKEIVQAIGLDYSLHKTKEVLIDEKLLGNRNRIAHGKFLLVDAKDYLLIHDEVFNLMMTFHNQVSNAALSREYELSA